MRIAQVMASEGRGGMERHVLELSAELAQTEDVALIAPGCHRERVANRVSFHALDLARSRRNPRLLWQLLQRLRQLQPDIIHAQGGKAMGLIATLAPFLSAARVATVHNTGKSLPGLRRFQGVIGVSHTITMALNHPCARTIYNGVSPPEAVPADRVEKAAALWPESELGRRWLAVGRLVPAKGFHTLIDAFAKVPGSLLIAGEGPERKALEQRIKARDLSARVRLAGHREDVDALMAACDAVVISSQREGFSYVFAEALLRHCPLVSTDVPVANELLPEPLLCPTSTPDALAQRMGALDPESPPQKEARARAGSLTLDVMARNTRQLYQQLLEGRHD